MASRYWVGGSGTWDNSSTTHWASSSGGSAGASVPTSSDNVFVDGNSGNPSITIGAAVNCFNLDFTGSGATSLATSGFNSLNVYGSLKWISTTSVGNLYQLNFKGTGSHTIDTAGEVFTSLVNFNGVGGTWTLTGHFRMDLTITEGSPNFARWTIENGTINTAGYDVDVIWISDYSLGTRSINLGSSLIRCRQFTMYACPITPGTSRILIDHTRDDDVNVIADNLYDLEIRVKSTPISISISPGVY